MRRVATGSQVAELPSPNAASGTPGYFNNTAPGLGVTPTVPGPDWFNIVQEEMMSILAAAGVAPDNTGATVNQLLTAINALIVASTFVGVSVNTTWTSAAAGYYVKVNGSATTQTLPAPSTVSGMSIGFFAANVFTLTTPSGGIYGGSLVNEPSASLVAGQFIFVKSDGSNWIVVSASPGLLGAAGFAGNAAQTFSVANATTGVEAVALGQFAATTGTENSLTLPNGIIIKLGSFSVTVAATSVNTLNHAYPTAFPNNQYFAATMLAGVNAAGAVSDMFLAGQADALIGITYQLNSTSADSQVVAINYIAIGN